MQSEIDIESICEELSVAQTEIAAACGVTQGAVSRWRPGQTQPSGSARILLNRFIADRRAQQAVEGARSKRSAA